MLLVTISLWFRSELPSRQSLGNQKGQGDLPSKTSMPSLSLHNLLTKAVEKEDKHEPVILNTSNFRGGLSYQLPSESNRMHSPWFRPPDVRLLTPEESNYRYLYAPTRMATSDGIGHSMGVVNYAFNFALRFNLTYTHRVGFYSSLTAYDRLAVENFFGWGDGEVSRIQVQTEGCRPENGTWPPKKQIYQCHICKEPLAGGAMQIKHFVNIPVHMEFNCHCSEERCLVLTAEYLRKHSDSHTIFQTPRESCSGPATDGDFLKTKNLFFHKYWNRHGQLLWGDKTVETTRPIRYKESELNVAIHVRRGDFLDAATRSMREITEDAVFAKILVDALSIVHEIGGVFANMPVAVHIYSEGKLSSGRVSSVHAINLQDRNYYDSNGIVRDTSWWQQLINNTLTNVTHSLPKIRVVFHISEETLLCLHEMVSADIFIGSKSGMSTALVWSLSRGIVLIPPSGPLNSERGKKGNICCSIPFKNRDGSFPHQLFRKYWEVFVAANALSASRASKQQS